MAEVNMEKAKEVFASLVNMLDTRDWKYEKFEDDLVIKSGIKGDDLPIEFLIIVKPRQEVVQLWSRLHAKMPEDQLVDGAIAVCVANNGLVNGSFDYNISDGSISFRMTTSYTSTELSHDLLERMIFVSASTIDEYNDRFFMIAKGMMTLQQFIEKEKEN